MSLETIYRGVPPLGTCLFHKELKPQEESFLDMMRLTFIPYLTAYSFTFFWLLMISFVFIYSLYWNQQTDDAQRKSTQSNQFLRVSQAALFELGENYPFYIVKNYHYYRLLTSMVLFRDFYHFMIAFIGIASISSFIQQIIGFKRVLVLAIMSGVGGLLIRNVFYSSATIESLTPVCGSIGFLIGHFLTNKNGTWKYYSNEKVHMILLLIGYFLLAMHLGISYVNISLCSMFSAMFFGLVLYFCTPDTHFERWKIPALVTISAMIGLSVFNVFFLSDPQQIER